MANSSDDFSQVISEEVTCPVCLEELKEPKMLNCSHNVCTECLEMMTRNKNLINIVCPTCRKPTRIPERGVRCLPTNAALVRVVEATLARKAKLEMKKTLATGKPMLELLAKTISDFDKPLRVLNEIHEKADELVEVIRNQEASLCREVEQFYGIKCETINEDKNDLDKLYSSASRSVQEAETIVEQTLSDPTKTINVAETLKEQMEEITKLDLHRDTTAREDLEFRINAQANINGILKDEKFGKLTKKALSLCRQPPTLPPRPIPSPRILPPYIIPLSCREPIQQFPYLTSASNTKELKPVPNVSGENYCDFCALAANLICKTCLKTICDKCKQVYKQDLCPPTKKEHQFETIYEESTNTDETDWSCERCTFLNSSSNKICAVCATSRGVNQADLPQSCTRKCQNCTYANEQEAKICKMCGCTFGLDNAESYI